MSQLSNIEQSSDNICVFKTIEDCNSRQSRPFSKFTINKWKGEDSVFQSIISTNSRPIPQPRKGRVKTRALPVIDPYSTNCWEDSSLCNLYSINGGLIDPITGYYVDNNHNTINPDDYLTYSNPDVLINAEGKIACDGEPGILSHNYYSGPGWRTSRVHPEKKTGLSRPIKHWRRQLLPRQFIDSQTDIPYQSLNNIDFDSNIPRRGRSNIQIDLLNRPGGYSTTNTDYLTETVGSNNQVSCIPIYVNKGKDKLLDNCNQLNKLNNIDSLLCEQSQALLKSRPIINRRFNPWSFSSGKGYLQARVKLYEQNNSFVFNKYTKQSDINKNKFLLSTTSLHLNHKLIYYQDSELNNNSLKYTKTCFTDCSCIAPVTFKPSNPNFKTNGAVTSNNNIRRKSKIAINRNQYNITNSWGVNGKHDSLYTKCNNYRVTQKGSYNCNSNIVRELIPSSDWSYMFAYGIIFPGPIDISSSYSEPRPANYNFFLNSRLKNFINTPVTQGILDYMQYYTKYATNMRSIFLQAFNFNQNISKWNVDNVTNMFGMFVAANKFNTNISNWNTSKSTNMASMFNECYIFNQNISNWNTSKVTTMQNMFDGAQKFNQDINWNTTNVKDMSYMFSLASEFNGNIGSWNVHNVTSMKYMFEDAVSFNQDISGWNTFNVTNMSGMFYAATSFNQNINWNYNFGNPDESKQWNTNKVKDMSYMFGYATNFNQDLSGLNTSNVTNMESMFKGATSFNQYINSFNGPNIFLGVTPLSWNVQNVTSMKNMFTGATSFNQPLGEWQLHNNVDLTNMFFEATKMLDYYDATPNKTANNRLELYPKNKSVLQTAITNNLFGDYGIINTWNTSRITSMASLFKDTSFNENITDWNVENVTEMGEMFMQAREFNNDLSWNVSNVTDFTFMFTSATNFNGNISEWDTQKVEAMNAMFTYASSFNQDISKWNTSKVTSMEGMFLGATSFNQPINNFSPDERLLNIIEFKEYKNNYWNVENVENMSDMFGNATSFNADIKYWNVSSVENMSGMFGNATSFNQDISGWDVSKVTNMNSMFTDATSFNQNLKDWRQHMRSDVILTDIFANAQAMINRFGNEILTISYSNWETVFNEP